MDNVQLCRIKSVNGLSMASFEEVWVHSFSKQSSNVWVGSKVFCNKVVPFGNVKTTFIHIITDRNLFQSAYIRICMYSLEDVLAVYVWNLQGLLLVRGCGHRVTVSSTLTSTCHSFGTQIQWLFWGATWGGKCHHNGRCSTVILLCWRHGFKSYTVGQHHCGRGNGSSSKVGMGGWEIPLGEHTSMMMGWGWIEWHGTRWRWDTRNVGHRTRTRMTHVRTESSNCGQWCSHGCDWL